jgi:IS5 family transposase
MRDAFRSRVPTSRRRLQIHRVRRFKGVDADERQRGLYQRLLEVTRQTVRQAHRVRAARQARWGVEWSHEQEQQEVARAQHTEQRRASRLAAQFDRFLPLVEQAIRQAQRRVLEGQPVVSREKVLSLFEPHTRVMQWGKTGAAVEFRRQVVLDEIEGGIVTRFHVLADGESERHQALPAIAQHLVVLGHPPTLVTCDRRLHAKGLTPRCGSWQER